MHIFYQIKVLLFVSSLPRMWAYLISIYHSIDDFVPPDEKRDVGL